MFKALGEMFHLRLQVRRIQVTGQLCLSLKGYIEVEGLAFMTSTLLV